MSDGNPRELLEQIEQIEQEVALSMMPSGTDLGELDAAVLHRGRDRRMVAVRVRRWPDADYALAERYEDGVETGWRIVDLDD